MAVKFLSFVLPQNAFTSSSLLISLLYIKILKIESCFS